MNTQRKGESSISSMCIPQTTEQQPSCPQKQKVRAAAKMMHSSLALEGPLRGSFLQCSSKRFDIADN